MSKIDFIIDESRQVLDLLISNKILSEETQVVTLRILAATLPEFREEVIDELVDHYLSQDWATYKEGLVEAKSLERVLVIYAKALPAATVNEAVRLETARVISEHPELYADLVRGLEACEETVFKA